MIGDARATLLERLALPPAPRRGTPERARWDDADLSTRRAWSHASVAPDRGEPPPPATDRAVIAALADRRIRTGWRLYAISVFVGWLLLMTVWGFGRSGHPDQASWYLGAGLLAGGTLAALGARRARTALRHARSRRDANRAEAP